MFALGINFFHGWFSFFLFHLFYFFTLDFFVGNYAVMLGVFYLCVRERGRKRESDIY